MNYNVPKEKRVEYEKCKEEYCCYRTIEADNYFIRGNCLTNDNLSDSEADIKNKKSLQLEENQEQNRNFIPYHTNYIVFPVNIDTNFPRKWTQVYSSSSSINSHYETPLIQTLKDKPNVKTKDLKKRNFPPSSSKRYLKRSLKAGSTDKTKQIQTKKSELDKGISASLKCSKITSNKGNCTPSYNYSDSAKDSFNSLKHEILSRLNNQQDQIEILQEAIFTQKLRDSYLTKDQENYEQFLLDKNREGLQESIFISLFKFLQTKFCGNQVEPTKINTPKQSVKSDYIPLYKKKNWLISLLQLDNHYSTSLVKLLQDLQGQLGPKLKLIHHSQTEIEHFPGSEEASKDSLSIKQTAEDDISVQLTENSKCSSTPNIENAISKSSSKIVEDIVYKQCDDAASLMNIEISTLGETESVPKHQQIYVDCSSQTEDKNKIPNENKIQLDPLFKNSEAVTNTLIIDDHAVNFSVSSNSKLNTKSKLIEQQKYLNEIQKPPSIQRDSVAQTEEENNDIFIIKKVAKNPLYKNTEGDDNHFVIIKKSGNNPLPTLLKCFGSNEKILNKNTDEADNLVFGKTCDIDPLSQYKLSSSRRGSIGKLNNNSFSNHVNRNQVPYGSNIPIDYNRIIQGPPKTSNKKPYLNEDSSSGLPTQNPISFCKSVADEREIPSVIIPNIQDSNTNPRLGNKPGACSCSPCENKPIHTCCEGNSDPQENQSCNLTHRQSVLSRNSINNFDQPNLYFENQFSVPSAQHNYQCPNVYHNPMCSSCHKPKQIFPKRIHNNTECRKPRRSSHSKKNHTRQLSTTDSTEQELYCSFTSTNKCASPSLSSDCSKHLRSKCASPSTYGPTCGECQKSVRAKCSTCCKPIKRYSERQTKLCFRCCKPRFVNPSAF